MSQEKANLVCREIYIETKAFYDSLIDELGDSALGFKILYGPPIYRAPILFVGFQPGGTVAARDHEIATGAHDGWPTECEYATQSWLLAENMRSMFGRDLLSRCTGLNAIFLRSRSAEDYRKKTPTNVRSRFEARSRESVLRIVDIIDPTLIVCIGFEALRFFGPSRSVLRNEAQRGLVEEGCLGHRVAFAVLHLSGARIAKSDRTSIADFVRSKIAASNM